ncbi:MAG: hypothetical protein ACRDXX_03710 [Stackebrandtia sp.]
MNTDSWSDDVDGGESFDDVAGFGDEAGGLDESLSGDDDLAAQTGEAEDPDVEVEAGDEPEASLADDDEVGYAGDLDEAGDQEVDAAEADSPADDETAEAVTVDESDAETPGADPDATEMGDDDAFVADFPPQLEVDDLPEPVDGQPWSDAGLLGDVADSGHSWAGLDQAVPPADDLMSMDGSAEGGWDTLLASDDPAVSSLARWWQP